jgi:HD-GYP domain-containing protein (c-di-GMP phosphodiesterase class II)
LTTDRPYRAAMSIDAALSTMEEETRRGWWDRDLFEAFRTLVGNGYLASDRREAVRSGSL